jgi:hypothetical protein
VLPVALLPLHRHANAGRQALSHLWPTLHAPMRCAGARAACTRALRRIAQSSRLLPRAHAPLGSHARHPTLTAGSSCHAARLVWLSCASRVSGTATPAVLLCCSTSLYTVSVRHPCALLAPHERTASRTRACVAAAILPLLACLHACPHARVCATAAVALRLMCIVCLSFVHVCPWPHTSTASVRVVRCVPLGLSTLCVSRVRRIPSASSPCNCVHQNPSRH